MIGRIPTGASRRNTRRQPRRIHHCQCSGLGDSNEAPRTRHLRRTRAHRWRQRPSWRHPNPRKLRRGSSRPSRRQRPRGSSRPSRRQRPRGSSRPRRRRSLPRHSPRILPSHPMRPSRWLRPSPRRPSFFRPLRPRHRDRPRPRTRLRPWCQPRRRPAWPATPNRMPRLPREGRRDPSRVWKRARKSFPPSCSSFHARRGDARSRGGRGLRPRTHGILTLAGLRDLGSVRVAESWSVTIGLSPGKRRGVRVFVELDEDPLGRQHEGPLDEHAVRRERRERRRLSDASDLGPGRLRGKPLVSARHSPIWAIPSTRTGPQIAQNAPFPALKRRMRASLRREICWAVAGVSTLVVLASRGRRPWA
jgi:hypothetical protein